MATLMPPRSRPTHFFFWALIFSVLLLLTRLGNLQHEVIDWDESTFIIMASHLRVGHLPYLELYDNLPPGISFALAGVMSLFGESLITVRFFGTLCLLVAALACYGIAVRRNSSLAAGVSTAVFLVLASASNFQPTLTEHLVIALLLPACWLLVARRDRLWAAFTIGMLLSLATLTRTNIAFVVLALGGYYAWRLWQPRKSIPQLALLAYGAGGLMPLLALLAVYAYADGLDELFLSVIIVPLSYASSQGGLLESLYSHIRIWRSFVYEYKTIFLPATAFIGTTFIGLTLYIAQQRRSVISGDEGLLLLIFSFTSFSVLMNGHSYGHHLLQILPLLAILMAYGLQGLSRNVAYIFAGLTIVAGVAHFGAESAALVQNWSQREARYDIRKAAELIREDVSIEKAVYAPIHHLVYWYLGPGSLPSRVVHPANLAEESIMGPLVEHGYLPAYELKRFWSNRLDYVIVSPGRPWYFSGDEYQAFQFALARDFELWQRVGGIEVFRRKS